MGQRLHRLEPDPVTAPTVVEIFEMYVAGYGLRAIAQALTDKGAPSPSEYDRRRNPHRDPRGWGHSAVRAILKNPVYTGVRMWGKQEKFERLIDPNDVAMGYQTRMRWRDQDLWVAPASRTHEPLVDDELFLAAQRRLQARGKPDTTRPRTANRRYPCPGGCRVGSADSA